jgi:hypothetical protein
MILAHPEPYPLIKEVDGLIATVQLVNDAAVAARRTQVLARVDLFIGEIKTALDQVDAPSELRHASLAPLQTLRAAVDRDLSIPSILQASTIAEDLKDEAIEKIHNYALQKLKPVKPDTPIPPPQFRKPRVVRIADIKKQSGFLESREDVDRFISDLKAACDAALAANEPIDLR